MEKILVDLAVVGSGTLEHRLRKYFQIGDAAEVFATFTPVQLRKELVDLVVV